MSLLLTIHPVKSHDCAYPQRGQEVQTCHGPNEGQISICGRFYVWQSTGCLEALTVCPQTSMNVPTFPPAVFASRRTPGREAVGSISLTPEAPREAAATQTAASAARWDCGAGEEGSPRANPAIIGSFWKSWVKGPGLGLTEKESWDRSVSSHVGAGRQLPGPCHPWAVVPLGGCHSSR